MDYKSESPWEEAEEFPKPTDILYAERDAMTSIETISKFVKQIGANLTVMKNGEHWFHTDEQIHFLDDWISKIL